ncbi:unnamed protein product [Arabidopsis lyrata]|nr:unnamed protein product [Arabidopsis lyrata]
MTADNICQRCGDFDETVNHLLFQCRVIREIWEHVLNQTAPDGSWISPTDGAGIGWVLYNQNAQFVLRGMAAINPMNTALETEAEALRLAMIHVNRMGYKNVTFCGDALNLFSRLQQAKLGLSPTARTLSSFSSCNRYKNACCDCISFFKVPRELNCVTDRLAKDARIRKLNFVISWNDVTSVSI